MKLLAKERMHASLMFSGVWKSGSPMENEMMSAPSPLSLLTRLAVLTVPDSRTFSILFANIELLNEHDVFMLFSGRSVDIAGMRWEK